MGEAKKEMKTTAKSIKSKGKGWFSKKEDPEVVATTFADHLDVCAGSIAHLVGVKESDVNTEGHSERPKNEAKVSLLKAMQHHIEAASDLASSYQDI